ncbi:uncharacterized protein [Eurosta solidaginis]|uniref:uncharacterized protein n=1 Tax=Eurosta solidaginis TaxID=178769 RepID=UPI003530DEA1
MGNAKMFTLIIFAFTCYVMCSCKFFSQKTYQLNISPNLLRPPLAAAYQQQHMGFNTDRLRYTKTAKRMQKYDNFLELPSTELLYDATGRMPYNEYNRIVSALKEMLRTRDDKTIALCPRPGRRSVDADFPLLSYFIDDAGNVGIDTADTAAIVDGMNDELSDGSLKKPIQFRPRLGKRSKSQISE